MNKFPSKEIVLALRRQYPKGARVALVRMNDPYTKLRPGDLGTVDFIDDVGTLFCRWDNGSTIGAVFGEDEIRLYDNTGTAD
ncbi:MAG: DUF4314 domain-containing protein [Candidatus Limiplasma sp.]|nr:DUF4314 domain-containing protein [Candidatus Limiplasma sp.]